MLAIDNTNSTQFDESIIKYLLLNIKHEIFLLKNYDIVAGVAIGAGVAV